LKAMKTRLIVIVLLIAALSFSVVACGKKNKNNNKNEPLTGRYVICDITDDPDDTSFAEFCAEYSEDGFDCVDYNYFEFSDGNNYVFLLFGEIKTEGTYIRNGNTLTLTASVAGIATTASVSGDIIIWEYDNGAKLIFEKK